MATAERDGDRIAVSTMWTEAELIKPIPGSKWDPTSRVWTLPLTFSACLQLRGSFGADLAVGPELTRWSFDEYVRRVQPATELRTVIDRVDGDFIPELYDFQTAGAKFINTAGSALLGDDLGLGKTAQILAALRALANIDPDEALPAIVICPNSVKTGWDRQVKLWNIDVNPYVVAGSATERRKILERAREDSRALVITNIESVRLLSRLAPFGSVRLNRCRECDKQFGQDKITAARCEVHPKILNGFGFRTVVVDEAHRIKDPSSKQTRACWAVAHDPSVRHRWAMTGTPVANHVGDLWSIMHLVAPSEYPTKTKFVDRYALQSWNAFGGLDIVGVNPQRKEEFYKILDARFRRTPKVLVRSQLPPVVRVTRWVDMTPKQKTAYTNLERQLITRLDDGSVLIAPNNLVNATRLLQLSSSYCNVEYVEQTISQRQLCHCADYGDTPPDRDAYIHHPPRHRDSCPGHEKRWCWCHTMGTGKHTEHCPARWKIVVTLTEPSPKLDMMEEDLDELDGKPVVIAAMSRQLIELAAARLKKRKISYGMITGTVTEWERQQAIQRFRDGQIRVMLMTIAAGGTGVDGLQYADTLICLQRSWSMIENVQLDGRIDRFGSEVHESVTVIDYITRDSIEETTQHPRLAEKLMRLEEINRDRARILEVNGDISHLDEEVNRIVSSHLGAPL